MIKKISSKHVGVTVDTGNSIALLEDPMEVVGAYAPWAMSSHIKDMGVQEYEDGFLLSEVPLGTGFLDMKRIVATLRKARPEIRLNLEMITRDPLKIPCLTTGYWATLEKLPAKQLAGALALVRKHAAKQPLPRISGLTQEKKLEVEEDNVRRCLEYAKAQLGV
jgi:sugar phosphate isomerase/epimerase